MAAERPIELELVILKALWEASPLTARQIREARLYVGGRWHIPR